MSNNSNNSSPPSPPERQLEGMSGSSHTISDSWVDLSGHCGGGMSSSCISLSSGPASPNRVTPVPFGGEQDYIRMLKEAQRESNRSSAKVSPISSAIMSLSSTTRNTPSASPKSPPNSPNNELASIVEDFKGVYINRVSSTIVSGNGDNNSSNLLMKQQHQKLQQPVTASELLWDWTSRPNVPPKEWQILQSSSEASSSSSLDKSGENGGKKSYYSKGIIYTLLLTNIFSLLIGAGIGMWLSKRHNNIIIVEL